MCVCTLTWAFIRIDTQIHMHKSAHMHPCTRSYNIYMCVYIYIYIYIYIYKHTHTYIYIYIYTHMTVSVYGLSIGMHIKFCVYVCVLKKNAFSHVQKNIHTHIHAYIHIHTHAHIHDWICIWTHRSHEHDVNKNACAQGHGDLQAEGIIQAIISEPMSKFWRKKSTCFLTQPTPRLWNNEYILTRLCVYACMHAFTKACMGWP